MHRIFRVKAYEAEHGPHFNEEHARKAVSKMENEDGTRGPQLVMQPLMEQVITMVVVVVANKERR